MNRQIRRASGRSEEYKQYRKVTRPYRRVFTGIMPRREAERLFLAVMRQSARDKLREQETA